MLRVTASYLLAKSISKSIGKSFQSNYSEATVDTKVLTPAQLCFFVYISYKKFPSYSVMQFWNPFS